MKKEIKKPIDLIGEEISAICFVRDYVELHFDGPTLRSLSNPIVIIHGASIRFPEPGSRDALCQLIGSSVKDISLKEGETLELITSENCRLIIRLNLKDVQGGETMHFVPGPNKPIQVW